RSLMREVIWEKESRNASPVLVAGSTNTSSRNSAIGEVSETHNTATPASRPTGPEALASDDTPITTISANTGLTAIAARVQRRPRQNHEAVVCASSPAAVIGTVETRTRIAACRQM